MRTRSKLAIAAIGAIALLGMAVGTASATHIEIVNWERGFRIGWSSLKLEAGGSSVVCPVTIEGSFAAHTFAKRAGTRIASVTGVAINNGACTGGHVTLLSETLPWEVTYNAFSGTLPNITAIAFNVVGVALQVEIGSVLCLMRTEAARPARGIASAFGGTIVGFRMDEAAGIETGGGFFCLLPSPGHFSGAANSITVRGGSEAMSVRLI